MSKLEGLCRLMLLAAMLGGIWLSAAHPGYRDPLHNVGPAVTFLAIVGNLALSLVTDRDPARRRPAAERWLMWIGVATMLLGGGLQLASTLSPTLPPWHYAIMLAGFAAVGLSGVLAVLRGWRMPKGSQRPPTLVLD
jgi:hypothetical protein